jgi:uncharacterized protein involved in exopolysaccharide biosynthesis
MQEFNHKFVARALAVKEQQVQLALERLKQTEEALASFVQSNGLTWDEVAAFEASNISPRIVIPGSSKSINLSAAPTQPKPLQNIAIAGVLGLMLGVFGAFALEYFQSPRKAAEGEAR